MLGTYLGLRPSANIEPMNCDTIAGSRSCNRIVPSLGMIHFSTATVYASTVDGRC
jgi:hypothetical protein